MVDRLSRSRPRAVRAGARRALQHVQHRRSGHTREGGRLMPNRLRDLMVTRVALVDRGANQKADIVLFKRDADMDPFIKRTFSADDRKRLASSGAAMSDGSFPIENAEDLRNAIQAVGRASNSTAAKAHVISRAKSLGLTRLLPDGWNANK